MMLAMLLAAAGSDCHGRNPTQAAMTECAGQDLDRADAELNSAWKAAYGKAGTASTTLLAAQRDWLRFRDVYGDPTSGTGIDARRPLPLPTATGTIGYAGQDAVARDTRALTAALAATGGGRGYLCALSPGSAARIGNAHYTSETEWLHAWAGVLRQEYSAILDAGLELQIDDPSLAESWDQVNPEPSVADYQRFVARRRKIRMWPRRHTISFTMPPGWLVSCHIVLTRQ